MVISGQTTTTIRVEQFTAISHIDTAAQYASETVEKATKLHMFRTDLLQTAVPAHLVHAARQQFAKSPPNVYTECYSQARTEILYYI
ncbi:unnamed protein product [Gongylonema pulchrum]|uniref:BRO1 domain-containing protein n=1 Tax=Gongylonema pulchrum TaxID=637853 RepID=A0A183D1D3_9BILA|nr:unnamed protein product [Gongylonema pulchrum]